MCDKLKQGKRVSLIVHNDYISNRNTGLNFQAIIDQGGKFYFSNEEAPMHNKFCIIDRKILINGSYNWTYYAEDKILLVRDENETINTFRHEFMKLADKLSQVKVIPTMTVYDFEKLIEYSSREYLARDIIYEAKATNRPEIIQRAFNLLPNDIKIQETALKLNLVKGRRLKYSIGVETKNDKYLVGIYKETSIPCSIMRKLVTIKDNQSSCISKLYYGDNNTASANSPMPIDKSNKQNAYLIIKVPPKPAGKAKMEIT